MYILIVLKNVHMNTKHITWRVFQYSLAGLIVLQFFSFIIFDIVRVNERQVAVVTRFGQVTNVHQAGWHFKIPYIDSVSTYYDLGVQSLSVSADSATKDQQTVEIVVNVQYRLNGSEAEELFKSVKNQEFLNTSIVPPLIQESIKSTSAQFTAAELLSKRDEFKLKVGEALQDRLNEYYSTVVAVNIENINFSDSFDAAIEAKVVAEQIAQRKQQELTQAKIDAEILITRSQAEADSIKIKGEAIRTNPEILEQQKIDKWDGKLPTVSGSNDVIIDLP